MQQTNQLMTSINPKNDASKQKKMKLQFCISRNEDREDDKFYDQL